ncbi:5'-nucleotidase/2',3'-cyclic phosphodiesterase, partial [gut metagenome]
EVQILFTHDMHSHLDSYKAEKEGETVKVGGFGKLKTLVDEKRKNCPATFLLDGGDFSMGTLYQTIYETEAAELVQMGRLGYDATTLGNHEFDYRSSGLAHMLHAAIKRGEEERELKLPALVSANIDWTKNTSKDNKLVKEALDAYGSTPYIVLERGGVRVGIYGVLGKDADACAPESGLEFEDIVETSKKW